MAAKWKANGVLMAGRAPIAIDLRSVPVSAVPALVELESTARKTGRAAVLSNPIPLAVRRGAGFELLAPKSIVPCLKLDGVDQLWIAVADPAAEDPELRLLTILARVRCVPFCGKPLGDELREIAAELATDPQVRSLVLFGSLGEGDGGYENPTRTALESLALSVCSPSTITLALRKAGASKKRESSSEDPPENRSQDQEPSADEAAPVEKDADAEQVEEVQCSVDAVGPRPFETSQVTSTSLVTPGSSDSADPAPGERDSEPDSRTSGNEPPERSKNASDDDTEPDESRQAIAAPQPTIDRKGQYWMGI